MHIDFQDNTNSVHADYVDTLQRLLIYTARLESVPKEAEMSVNFVNNKEIQEINRNYRGKNEPTDVISFALQDTRDGEVIGENLEFMPLALGDIVISVEQAKKQASVLGHSIERELSFLTVHGFLHLLGYDHQDKDSEKYMFRKQNDILGVFGIER